MAINMKKKAYMTSFGKVPSGELKTEGSFISFQACILGVEPG